MLLLAFFISICSRSWLNLFWIAALWSWQGCVQLLSSQPLSLKASVQGAEVEAKAALRCQEFSLKIQFMWRSVSAARWQIGRRARWMNQSSSEVKCGLNSSQKKKRRAPTSCLCSWWSVCVPVCARAAVFFVSACMRRRTDAWVVVLKRFCLPPGCHSRHFSASFWKYKSIYTECEPIQQPAGTVGTFQVINISVTHRFSSALLTFMIYVRFLLRSQLIIFCKLSCLNLYAQQKSVFLKRKLMLLV